MENLKMCQALQTVVTRRVDWPLYSAVGLDVYWVVDRTVQLPSHMRVGRDVFRTVNLAVFADPPHPGLALYLGVVDWG